MEVCCPQATRTMRGRVTAVRRFPPPTWPNGFQPHPCSLPSTLGGQLGGRSTFSTRLCHLDMHCALFSSLSISATILCVYAWTTVMRRIIDPLTVIIRHVPARLRSAALTSGMLGGCERLERFVDALHLGFLDDRVCLLADLHAPAHLQARHPVFAFQCEKKNRVACRHRAVRNVNDARTSGSPACGGRTLTISCNLMQSHAISYSLVITSHLVRLSWTAVSGRRLG